MELTRKRTSMMSRSGIWMAAGAVVILILVVLSLSIRNYHREVKSSERLLLVKGGALLRTIEAGTRAGMLRMRWGRSQLQHLLEETGRQPDIRFIAIVTPSGRILAHSIRERVGKIWSLPPGTLQEDGLQTAPLEGDTWGPVLMVWREFRPLARQGRPGRMGEHMGRVRGQATSGD